MSTWALRFVRKLQKKSTIKGQLTSEEISHKPSKGNLGEVCSEECVHTSNQCSQRNNLKNQLGLQLDENEVLRCHGRLISENLPENTVLPKLPPKNHVFVKEPSFVIKSFHEKLMHAGVSHILAATSREFWISQDHL